MDAAQTEALIFEVWGDSGSDLFVCVCVSVWGERVCWASDFWASASTPTHTFLNHAQAGEARVLYGKVMDHARNCLPPQIQ